MIIATAGHVDHGKTTLLQAITGVNADRLPEEKKRGMTIDLGYAYWPQPDGRVLGFIDVPGHEKFLSNMLAGVGGIDHALLVVACDDGVMAQTREHLAILQLTGNPQLTVALTKADRVDATRINEVREAVQATLREYGFTDAALFETVATEGRGIDALRHHLQQLSSREHASHHRFRLAIDRAFTVKGAGLVVTGTALSGEVKVGDTVWLTGINKPMRVRGLHAQNQPVDHAHAGQRIALNIAGDAEKAQLNRGDWLLSEAPPEPSERVIVSLQTHIPLSQWQPLHIHHAASHITGRVSLLENDLAELVFDTPLWLADNDRLVLRDISARETLAGARVVTLNPPRRGKRKPEYLQWLSALAQASNDKAALEVHLERGAVNLTDFAWARQLSNEGLLPLTQQPGFIQAGNNLLNAPVAACWQRKVLNTLATYHEQHQDEPGPGRERLRRMALPMEDDALVLLLIENMRESGVIKSHHGWLHLPDHKAGFTAEQEAIWQKAAPLFGDEPWWVRDLARETNTDEQVMRQVLRHAAQQGLIVAIVKDRYYRNDRIVAFASLIRELDQARGSTCAADFRDRLNVGRKLAIQILEYFNRIGFTRRRGNDHLLRDSLLFPETA
ncbi:selenocysteine-specific translation elongation factor [Enterobacter cloacae subsp. cloacae]|jgi:selenocysteine-specific elongation factor|uniref:Selenocysteine-specific elongation factor n=3 Tax=Enterobacter cloacae complex TaxID=354276 RepID=A0A0H3CDS7_ENTCC|nr:selenocysteine-specific translation elongation factor [Enterobacter cloacae]MBP7742837.1 selenocysteine-specific translation elongation factor [Enterobacter sp.]ADF59744.1 selenocysteinyl-tRNA-specific translation factor [Enterobacter cloacae subsp. cloacae ATCC 13047]ELV2843468.1 selenocysteine-specific translation elongation factor [Enterobacter cloacae]EMC0025835.1 selenocysteine-specific translation elongation factor [Enterobacter cloacae]KGB10322.1 selenocysteine-specific translation e